MKNGRSNFYQLMQPLPQYSVLLQFSHMYIMCMVIHHLIYTKLISLFHISIKGWYPHTEIHVLFYQLSLIIINQDEWERRACMSLPLQLYLNHQFQLLYHFSFFNVSIPNIFNSYIGFCPIFTENNTLLIIQLCVFPFYYYLYFNQFDREADIYKKRNIN